MISRLRKTARLWRSRLRSRRRAAGLGAHARAILTESANGLLLVDPRDAAVGWQLAHEGGYEAEELAFLQGLVTAESRVCVVGGHVGAMVVPLAGACREVLAFEANPATCELLRMNLRLNGLDNVEVRGTAMGEKIGRIEFLANTVNSGGSKRKPASEFADFTFDHPDTIEVEMTTLRDALPEGSWDLMVMDIEGSECFALKGAGQRLGDIRQLHIEYDVNHLKHVAGIDNAGFLALLRPWFSTVRVVPEDRAVAIDAIAGRLDDLWQQQGAANLLFAK